MTLRDSAPASLLISLVALFPSTRPLHAQEPDLPAADQAILARAFTELLPKRAKSTHFGPTLSRDLTRVPEVMLTEPLDEPTATEARAALAKQMTQIRQINESRADAFIETLTIARPDLRGLPFLLGDACRLDCERVPYYISTLALIGNGPDRGTGMVEVVRDASAKEEAERTVNFKQKAGHLIPARVALLMQIAAPESPQARTTLARYLGELGHSDATRALARLAVFAAERDVREAAIEALKIRREKDYTPLLLDGLRYPWPDVAKHAAEAMVQLERDDLVPQLVDMLDQSDPRAPVIQKVNGKPAPVVRELVRVNHLRNCVLCHAPADLSAAPEKDILLADIPVFASDGEVSGFYGAPARPDPVARQQRMHSQVRIDVTYLRQDFSVMLPVPGASPGFEEQRFDFLVRTRVVSEKEADVFRDKLAKRGPGAVTPYERAILFALRELTGRDTEPTAAAWRELLAHHP